MDKQRKALKSENTRSYGPNNSVYRAVYDFHARNSPPRLDNDGGAGYWTQVLGDLKSTDAALASPFARSMLFAVIDDLEREFTQIQKKE